MFEKRRLSIILLYGLFISILLLNVNTTSVLADPGEVFLPLIARKAQTLPAPPPGQELINGDFESGYTGWTFYYDAGDPILQQNLSRSPTTSARLGIYWDDPENDPSFQRHAYISQKIYVPSDRTLLRYYEFINSLEEPILPATCTQTEILGDWVYVYIKSTLIEKFSLCSAVNTPDWSMQQIDLSSYMGSWITFKIEYRSDATISSTYYVDDVSLVAP